MGTSIPDDRRYGDEELVRLLMENVRDYGVFVVDEGLRVLAWGPGAARLLGYTAAEIVGQSADRLFTSEDVARGAPLYEVRMAAEQGRVGEYRWHVRKDGSRFWTEGVMIARQRELGSSARTFVKIMWDRTDLKRQREFAAEQTRLAAFVRDIWLALVSEDDLSRMLARCTEVMVGQLEGAFARIWTLNGAGDVLELQASAGIYTHLNGPHSRVPVGTLKIGLIAAERQPHLTNAVLTDPRVSDKGWAEREGMVAFAGYPLMIGDRLLGVMAMFARHTLSDSTLEAMAAVAYGIAVGIDRKLGERRLASSQQELTASEVRNAAIVRTALDAIVVSDNEGRVIEFNPAAEAMFGFASSDVLGRDLADFIIPHRLREAHHRGMARFLSTGEGLMVGRRVELPALRADGSEFPIELIIAHAKTDHQSLFIGYLRDITERIEADRRRATRLAVVQTLVRSGPLEETARGVLQAVCAGLNWDVGLCWAFDRDAEVLRCMAGWRSPQVATGTLEAASRRISLASGEGMAGAAWSTGQPIWMADVSADSRFKRREAARADDLRGGYAFPIVIGTRLLGVLEFFARRPGKPDAGLVEVMGAIGVKLGHYLERQRTEEQLRLLGRAVETLTEGIVITDPRQRDNPIIYASPSVERLTGYPRHESIGKNCRFLQGRDTNPDAVAELRKAVRDVRPCSVEILNYRKDGTPFWNAVSIYPVRNGELTHIVGILADVTGRRRLEEQFRQSQKMEAVGQLAGGVAHDFNNLLTIINGYSELMLDDLPPGNPMRALVAEVQRAGERAGTLTRQLLVFSRQQVVQPRVLDLNAVVADAEKMLRRLIGEDVRMAIKTDPALGPVKADAGQIEQVIMNLCVNARDAMPTGGQLTLDTQNVELDEDYAGTHSGVRPGDYSMLAVSDTGTGMNEATKARIFEPFFTTKGAGKGTGLGLAVVFGVVQQSGGHIEVYTEVGRGTTFKVYLPQVRERLATGKSSSGLAAMPKGTETVLLVEDEAGVRALARHILVGCGYTVLGAGDGREAIRILEGHAGPLHLLVSDVVMPFLGGRQLAEKVAALRPGIKVLFLSGYTDDAVVRHGVLEAEFAFLQKPFTPSGLAVKVRETLDKPA